MATAADVQRLFLQAVMSRGLMTEKMARLLHRRSVAAVRAANSDLDISYGDSDAFWEQFVISVNEQLSLLDLSVKFTLDEVTGTRMCLFINEKSDEISQLATDYTVGEIAYFKAVVEQIMLAPREAFSVSSFAALREVTQVKGMTKSQAESVLASFVANGWLLRSRRGRYSLSLRTILELSRYFKDNYSEQMNECTICHELVTKGVGCHRPNCQVRMHHSCLQNMTKTGRSKCPACSMDWNPKNDSLIAIGEEAARDGDESRRRTRQVEGQSDDEEDEEEESQNRSQKQTQSQSQPPKSQRRRKGKREADTDADDDDDDEEEKEEEEEDVKPAARHPDARRA